MELIRRFDVGDLFEQIHQFGQVEKLCKARPCPVAGALRGKLQRGGGFTKAACPAIKVAHTHLLQPVRQLSKVGRSSLSFELPLGFEEAAAYRKANGQYVRKNQWRDTTVTVYIDLD